ncbi:MAG: exosortase N, partial [Verrucomicrobia bacterium]|nr:exosortase N [Cytophagales bacterium]
MKSVIQVNNSKTWFYTKNWLPILCLFGYAGIGMYAYLNDFISLDFKLLAGLGVTLFTFKLFQERQYSFFYSGLTIFCGVLLVFCPLRTLLYLTLWFGILALAESISGNIGYLPLFFVVLISPVFDYFSVSLGFPIRLKITELAGILLNQVGFRAGVSGNIIHLKTSNFSVDEACMGLHLLQTALLIGLLMMGFEKRRTEKNLSFGAYLLLFSIILCLTVFCNLIRICALVIFNIPPENIWHEAIGILCFVIYVVLPSAWLVRLFYQKFSQEISTKTQKNTIYKQNFSSFLQVILMLFIAFQVWQLSHKNPNNQGITADFSLKGFNKSLVKNNVLKFENENNLIYLKPIPAFYSAEHSPMICWQGSGYVFTAIHEKILNGTHIYT